METRSPVAGGGADMVFTLLQEGGALTGSLESAGGGGFGGGGFGGGAAGGPVQDGKVEGANISFRVGLTTYSGAMNGDRIELQRSGGFGRRGGRGAPAEDAGPRPAIGPPPDGTDPSFGAGFGGGGRGGGQAPQPLILRRVTR